MSRSGNVESSDVAGRRSLVRILACLAAVAALSTACTDKAPTPKSTDPDAVSTAVADTKAGKAPSPAQRCNESGNTTARKVVLTTSDHVNLAGVTFGSGTKGVLMLPQDGADLCPWWDYATELVGKGYLVLAIDLRGTGYSDSGKTADYTADAEAGIAELKGEGAARVIIIGASLGAATALVTAGRVPDQVAGVVALSYPDNNVDVTAKSGKDPHTPIAAAALITSPVMVCFTVGDKRSTAKPQELMDKVHSTGKQMVGRPGVSHGWDMLKIGDDDVRPDILGFLASYA